MGEWNLRDDMTLVDRLHWYAAHYHVMLERATRWDIREDRLVKRVNELGERNEELVRELAVVHEEVTRAWKALRDAGIKADDGDEG